MTKDNKELVEDAFIQSGSALGGALVGGIIGGPPGAYVGAVITPIATNIVKGLLGPKEIMRVDKVRDMAIQKYQEIKKKSPLRKDVSVEDLAPLVEGTLLSARNAYEEKKVPLLANLVAKAPFTNTPIDNLNQTLLQAERMSYRQLCLLAIIESNSWKGEWDLSAKPFKDEEQKHFKEIAEGIYSDLNLMIADGTIAMTSEGRKSIMMSAGVGFIVPALLIPLYPGRLLVNGLELSSIPHSELDYLAAELR